MNLNLLQLVSKCTTLAIMSITSIFNTSGYIEREINVENENTEVPFCRNFAVELPQ